METPSSDKDLREVQVETPKQGNETLTKVITIIQEPLGGNEVRPQLEEPSSKSKTEDQKLRAKEK